MNKLMLSATTALLLSPVVYAVETMNTVDVVSIATKISYLLVEYMLYHC